MATYDDIELEKLAEVDKHEQRKSNTLGADGSHVEEPFGLSNIILREDIFSETPTANTNFASPDYGDYPNGVVASRQIGMRLHPLVTSGQSGNSSIQTFVVVSGAPETDRPEAIEAVRIKRLVPADLSLGRRTAADPDPNFRGFGLALYPARNSGGVLEADFDKPIPTTADPGATYGVGDSGRWTVDYANGIVRFSRAPLNGTTGLMNPNDVYGDIHGNYLASASGGRITMFATFYQYVGPVLTDPDDVGVVTVGDGTNSFGNFYGPTSAIMQQAVDSLATYGGTVLLKEGDYSYDNSIHIPANVKIVGLSKRARITKPDNGAAFIIFGSNSSIEGVTVLTGSSTIGADIEVITNVGTDLIDGSRTVSDITIKDNILWASLDAYGVAFAPRHQNSTFDNIKIENNVFKATSTTPTYIGERLDGGSVTLNNIRISENDFGEDVAKAFYINGTAVEDIRELHIIENHANAPVNIWVDTGIAIENANIQNNSEFERVYINGLSGAMISNNICSYVTLDGYLSDSQFCDNIIYSFNQVDTASAFKFSGNTCMGDVIFNGNQVNTEGLLNVEISNNIIRKHLKISDLLTYTGSYQVDNLVIEDNRIDFELQFSFQSDMLSGSSVTYNNLRVRGNTIGDGEGTPDGYFDAIKIGTDGAGQQIYLNNVVFENNNLLGDLSVYENTQTSSTSEGFRVVGNTFDPSRGLYYYGYVINRAEIFNNRLTDINIFGRENTPSSGVTNSDITIKDNTIMDGGDIVFEPRIQVAGALSLDLNNVVISGNVFEGVGNLSVLNTTDGNENYNLVDIFIENNKLTNGDVRIGNVKLTGVVTDNIVLANNYIDGEVFIGGGDSISKLQILDNKVIGAVGVAENTATLTFTNNTVTSLEFGGTLTGGVIEGNKVTGSGLGLVGAVSDITVASNDVDGYVSVGSTLGDSHITDNRCTKIEVTGAITRSKVVGNTTTDTGIGFASSSTINDSVINSNNFDGSFIIYGAATETLISSNVFDNAVDFKDTADKISLLSNELNDSAGGLYFRSTANNCVVNDNRMQYDFTVTGAATSMNVTGNQVAGIITFSDATTRVTISDNGVTTGTAYLTLTGRPQDVVISNNEIGDTTTALQITNSSGGTKDRLIIEGNIFKGSATISGTDLNYSSITDNRFDAAVVFTADWTEVAFANNICASSVSGGTVTSSTVTSNSVSGALDLSTISKAGVSQNVVGGIVTLAASSDLTMVGNTLSSTLTIAQLTDCTLASNVVADDVQLDGAVLRAALTGNLFSGNGTPLEFTSTVTDTIIADAYVASGDQISGDDAANVSSALFSGAVSNLTVSDSRFAGALRFASSMTSSKISGCRCEDLAITGAVYDLTFSDNTIGVNVSFGSEINRSVLSDNIIQGTTVLSGIVDNTTISGNTSTSLLIVSGAITDSGINNNRFDGIISLVSLLDSTVGDNTFGSTFGVSSTITSSTIGDNRVEGAVTLTGNVAELTMAANQIGGDIDIVGTVQRSTITGNVLDGSSVSIDFQAAVYDLAFVGNRIASDVSFDTTTDVLTFGDNEIIGAVTFAGIAEDITVSSNVIRDPLEFSAAVNRSVITNNTSDSTLIVGGAMQDSTISTNRFAGAISLVSLLDSTVSGNTFGSSFSVSSTITSSTIGDNRIEGIATLTGNVAELTMASNQVGGDIDIVGTVQRSAVTGNVLDGSGVSIDFQAAVTDLTFTGNEVLSDVTFDLTTNTVTFGDNQINGDVAFTGAATAVSVANNNLRSGLTFGSTATDLTVVGNTLISTLTITGAATYVSVANNSLADVALGSTAEHLTVTGNVPVSSSVDSGLAITGTTSDSNISGNSFGGALSLAAVSASTINGNYFGSSTAVVVTGALSDVAIGGNKMVGTTTLSGTVSATTISNNTSAGLLDFANQVTDVVVSDNIFTALTMDHASNKEKVTVTGNDFTGTISVINNVFSNSVFSNNTCSGATFNIGAMTDSTFANNTINGSTTSSIGALIGTSVSGNVFGEGDTGDVEFTGTITDSTISGNIFRDITGYSANFVAVNDSVISDNIFRGPADFDGKIERVTIDGNQITGVVNFNSATGTDDFLAVSFSNNTCTSSITVDGKVDDARFVGNSATTIDLASTAIKDDVIISNNEISTSIGVSSSGVLTNSVISGNTTPALSFNPAITSVTIDGNVLGTITFTGIATDVSVSDNTLTGAIAVNAAPAGMVISGNKSDSTLTVAGGPTDVIVDGNSFTTVTFSAGGSKLVVSNNSLATNLALSNIDDSSVVGNTITGTLTVGTSAQTSIVGNHVETTSSFGAPTDVTIGGNSLNGAVTFSAALTRVNISDNTFGSTISLPALTSTDIVISDNVIAGDVSAAAGTYTYTGLECAGNVFSGLSNPDGDSLKFEGRITISNISSNMFEGNVIFDADISDGTISSSNICSNTIGGTLTIRYDGNSGTDDAALRDSTLTNNNVTGAVEINAAGSSSDYASFNSNISGNVFASTLTLSSSDTGTSTMSNTNISDNVIGDGSTGGVSITHTVNTMGGMVYSVFSNNKITGNLTIVPNLTSTNVGIAIDSSIVSGNTVFGSMTVCAATRTDSQMSYNNSVISDNRIVDSATFYGRFVETVFSGNNIGDQFNDALVIKDCNLVKFVNNNINNTADFGIVVESVIAANTVQGVLTLNGDVSRSSITGNVFDNTATITGALTNCTLGDNYILGAITWNGTTETSTVSGNRFDGKITYGASATVTGVSFVGNYCDDIDFDSLTNSVVSDNSFSGLVNIKDVVLETTVSDNVFDAATTSLDFDSTITSSVISGNRVTAALNLDDAIATTTISDNAIGGKVTFGASATFTDSTLGDNTFAAVDFDDITDSTINGNTFSGLANIKGAVADSVLSDNNFSAATTSLDFDSTATSSVISGNRVDAATIFGGTITTCVISDNLMEGTLTTAAITTSTISGNQVGDLFDTAANTITSSKISGNTFEEVTLERVDNVVWNDNRHTSTFNIEPATNTDVAASQFMCSGNLFENTVTIRHQSGAKTSDTDSLLETSIINNTFALSSGNALVIGFDTADTHNWSRSSIMNNCGTGKFVFYADNPESALKELHIIGNNINGDLDFQCASGDIDNPSGLGTDEHMIALNFFTGYTATGATWTIDNDKAIGWGTGNSSGTVTTEPGNR